MPEAVREDASSESDSAGQARNTDVPGPGGALFAGLYVPRSGDGDQGGDGLEMRLRLAAEQRTDRPAAGRMGRIDQQFSHYQEDAPACEVCGAITVRNGNCYKCYNCGSSLGCS